MAKNYKTFAPTIALASLKAVSLHWDVFYVESTAGNVRRRHPSRQNSSRYYPGDPAEVFIWQNFQPTYLDLENRETPPPPHTHTSYKHIENFTKDLEEGRDLGNRAHAKRPLLGIPKSSERQNQEASSLSILNKL